MVTSFKARFNFNWPLTLENDLKSFANTKINDLKNNGKMKWTLAWDPRGSAFFVTACYGALRKSLHLWISVHLTTKLRNWLN